MKWTENKEYGRWDSDLTPLGKFSIVEQFSGYTIYLDTGQIGEVEALDKAKDEVMTYLSVIYYKLKIYLEI